MAASNPNSSVKYVVFCLPPAIPTTFAPLILAICHTTEPTAPDAADTTTVSPDCG